MEIVCDSLVLIGCSMHVEIFSCYLYLRRVRDRPRCKIETLVIPCIDRRLLAAIIQCLFHSHYLPAVLRDHSPMVPVLWADKQHNPRQYPVEMRGDVLYAKG